MRNPIAWHVPSLLGLTLASTLFATGATAQSGLALRYDGSNDYVTVPAGQALDLTNSYTLEAWVRPEVSGTYSTILGRGAGLNRPYDYIFQLWNDDRIALNHGGTWHFSTTPLPADVWSHVAVVVTPTTWTFFLNGVADGSGSHSTILTTSTDPLILGRQGNLNANFFRGAMDDVRIWDVPRTQRQIQAGMAGIPNPASEAALVAYFRFEGFDQSVTGSSAYRRQGVLGASSQRETTDPQREWVTPPRRPAGLELAFDACKRQIVTVPASSALNLTNSFTLESWVRRSGTGFATILGRGEGTNRPQDYIFQIGNAGNIGLNLGGTWYWSSAVVPLEEWHHVAVVVTPTTWQFVMDGFIVRAGNHSRTVMPANDPLFLGRQGNLDANHMDGLLDEVRVWNTARSVQQIRSSLGGVSDPINAPGLVAYYRFEGVGQTVTDASVYGLDGVLGSNPTVETIDPERPAQPIGSSDSLEFGFSCSRSGDQVSVPSDSALDLTNAYTLEAWVRPSKAGEFLTILGRGTGTANAQDYIFQIWNDGRVALAHGANSWFLSSGAVQPDLWSHVAVVVTPTSWEFYLDGVPSGSGAHSTTLSPGTDPLFVGKQGNLNANYFQGGIDDVRIWKAARTQAQIQAGMAGITNHSAQPDLVACYEFAGTDQTVVDSSANGLHGTLGTDSNFEPADPRRACERTRVRAVAACPPGHHRFGGPILSPVAGLSSVTVHGSNLSGSVFCGVLIGLGRVPLPLSQIGSTVPNSAMCVDSFVTFVCGSPATSFQLTIPLVSSSGLCGAAIDIQIVDWAGQGLDFGTSQAYRLSIGR